MNRLMVVIIGILAVGACIQPLLTGANQTADPASHDTDSTITQNIPVTDKHLDDTALVVFKGTPGYWRLAQDANGVWWFLSPQSKREFLNTVTTVQPYQGARQPNGPHYISRDWSAKTVGGDGDLQTWATKTLQRVREAGFKGLGAWSNAAFHHLDVPMTRDLNVSAWVHSTRRIYDLRWAAQAQAAIEAQVVPLKENKNLVGYYIDNELDWGDSGVGPWLYFDGLSKDDPNRRQVISVIRQLWSDISQFNKDWQTRLHNWNDLDTWTSLPSQSPAYSQLSSAWLEHYARDYFKLTTSLIRQYDPNHLILGVRFKSLGPPEVARASRDYTDAQSLNYYVDNAMADETLFDMLYKESGQPIIISEYAFHALDGRSGNRNTFGFAAQVPDQQARADGYKLFTTRLARIPYVIGADWFQWSDEPPSGRSADGEDVNFGIVDIDDRPYQLLTDAVRRTTPLLNPLHAQSTTDPQTDVWQESFARLPTMKVPWLANGVNLDGELSDWPADSQLKPIRLANTVGVERSHLPSPRVFLGYNDTGLFIGMEVFDNDISGAPADGWWWTQDYVELWLSTRTPAENQTTYTPDCYQFFFIPQDFSSESKGIVGQWHRPGDALSSSLIPHPNIQHAVRIRHDRYTVELFIPVEALNGFDPAQRPNLAFNVHIRNFQHAISYFWSAPKEAYTQLRPNTWGKLELMPPAHPDAMAAAR